MKSRKINRGDLVLLPDIPPDTEKAAIITYLGKSIIVPIEVLENGDYRIEFIKQYGIPLPTVPAKRTEFFSPNLCMGE